MDENEALLALFPFFAQARASLDKNELNFSYYCSAEVAFNILRHKKFWLRSVNVMNDFLEVDHGMKSLMAVSSTELGQEFRALINSKFPDMWDRVIASLNSEFFKFKTSTYIICVSEHPKDEDLYGRLSMWRAYGGESGVALVLNKDVIMDGPGQYNVVAAPVTYEDFNYIISQSISSIYNNPCIFDNLSPSEVEGVPYRAFKYLILCCKHPGFREEREWRFIYTPYDSDPERRLQKDVECIRGRPQIVYKVKINDEATEINKISMKSLISGIIIGPTEGWFTLYQAFYDELLSLGFSEGEIPTVLKVSHIPLRHKQ